ncbi:MAG TPA: HNH endonuclease [Ktedonosporobacter sp.]|nr:HNH endonuclease [Ktedonosporobacter sp.]
MHNPLLVPLLVVAAVLIVGIALLRLTNRASHRRKGLSQRGYFIRGREDHGAHVARQHGHERSPEWARVAQVHRLREPACVACGYRGKKLQVHHIKPFHLHPHLELDPENLITLCEARGREHHLLLGHLDAWDSYNEHIRADAKHFYRKTARQIREDLHWQKKITVRP